MLTTFTSNAQQWEPGTERVVSKLIHKWSGHSNFLIPCWPSYLVLQEGVQKFRSFIELSCPSGRKSRWELGNPRQFVPYTSLWNEKASYEIRGRLGLRKVNGIHAGKIRDVLKHHRNGNVCAKHFLCFRILQAVTKKPWNIFFLKFSACIPFRRNIWGFFSFLRS